MNSLQLLKVIRSLPVRASITEGFDRKLSMQGQEHRNEWWSSHKEHWIGWIEDHYINGKGQSVADAKTIYNRLMCQQEEWEKNRLKNFDEAVRLFGK